MRTISRPFGQFGSRQQTLRASLEKDRLDWLLLTNATNIYYLTGFRGTAGVALIGQGGGVLWVDPRYTLQASEEARGVEVREERKGLALAAARWVSKHGKGRVGYEDSNLSVRSFEGFREMVGRGVRLVPSRGLVEELRVVKGEEEVAAISAAGKITADAFQEVLPEIRPGARESDLAAELEYRMRRKGAEGAAFEIIVASGARGAFPHARASGKLLEKCDLVIFDLGAIISGYAADMTRTLYLGKPGSRVRSLYKAVLGAQQRGLQALQEGVRVAGEVDAATRASLRRRGLARYFIHSTGHGVGLDIHESPRLGHGEKSLIKDGSVVTVEPGVYLEGLGGIRIEDTVHVTSAGVEILTPASKSDWILA
jgi:Xaa-Pro aminopeptidase